MSNNSDANHDLTTNMFFEQPILNSPYEYPNKHWELKDGSPTQKIINSRRKADFITPIPKPKKYSNKKQQNDSSAVQGSLFQYSDKADKAYPLTGGQ